ncbi:hypothetical protein [Streptomyces sp. NBC_01800]|uniref:hypothetical protein n=1 Tax=Streptomyces sp. NBC_01800 TaxID=2975945 RepID=UPI002DDA3DDB|nr:hypothetical protein [Streptomyces sp. NBC_01800]WSA68864.1 hypothetical protein OIE65_18775 [Streptomyces sp. NBC_01800]
MPATLVVLHPAPLTAPLSRTEGGVIYEASPCQACGVAGGAHWIKVDGIGVLVHNARGRERCPVAVCFDWETGKPLPALTEAVAA